MKQPRREGRTVTETNPIPWPEQTPTKNGFGTPPRSICKRTWTDGQKQNNPKGEIQGRAAPRQLARTCAHAVNASAPDVTSTTTRKQEPLSHEESHTEQNRFCNVCNTSKKT